MLPTGMSRTAVRLGFCLVLLGLLLAPATAFVSQVATADDTSAKRVESVSGPDRDGYTVITTQQFSATYPDAEMVVIASNGSTVYANTRWDSYFDVDPVPGEQWTVEYAASKDLSTDDCNREDICTREVLVRENIRTGDSEVIWSRISPGKHETRVHDIDRINESRIVIADIYQDAVYVYDTDRNIQVWRWNAQSNYSLDSGGPYPADWTHVNDVEVLPDGRFMVSLRNHDSVVFLAPNGTMLSSQTLGSDDDHDVLYEQHNPDYIPSEQGGPAVLVANSELDKVEEFQRTDGEWQSTWSWRDQSMKWPRDADRLPNNHTLITDTLGGRVVEIDSSGEVVWSVSIGLPYEAERLSTGDESAGGHSASTIGLQGVDEGSTDTQEDTGSGVVDGIKTVLSALLPSKLINGILFALPQWAVWWHVPLVVGAFVDLLAWGVVEFRWSRYELRSPLVERE